MTELITKNHWWPGVMRDMGKYIEGCYICQRMKNRTEVSEFKIKDFKYFISASYFSFSFLYVFFEDLGLGMT